MLLHVGGVGIPGKEVGITWGCYTVGVVSVTPLGKLSSSITSGTAPEFGQGGPSF